MRKRKEEDLSPLILYKKLREGLANISDFPEWEAREIIYHVTGKKLADFLLEPEVNEAHYDKIADILSKRREGRPLHYILHSASFMGIDLEVNESVLIPRNETEILVEQVLKEKKGKVLEIGTGSGAIAIVLAKNGFNVVATDVSLESLNTAKKNAQKHKVVVDFRKGAYFRCVRKGEKFDYIVSNPPYVSFEEYNELPIEVKKEPRIALVSSFNGMWHSCRIMAGARKYLKQGGELFLEISPHRADKYVQAAYALGYSGVELIKDLNDNFRVLKTRWE